MLMRLRNEERGIAMVVVLLVTLVLVSLSLVVVQLATHSSSSSEFDQRRIKAAHLAERGLNEYLTILEDTTGTSLCTVDNVPQTVAGPINQTYTLQITLYKNGTPTECQDYTGVDLDIDEALIASTATVGTATANSGASTRTIQERVTLTPIYSEALDQAIYGATTVTISNNTTVRHYQDVNDANVYAGCDLGSTTPSEKFTSGFELEGSLIAQCNIYDVKGYVLGNIWAKGNISTGSLCVGHKTDCGGGIPESAFGWITSTQGNVDLGSTWAEHSCTAKAGSLLNTIGTPQCGSYLWSGATQGWMTNTPVPNIYNSGSCPAIVAAIEMSGTSMCSDPPVIAFPAYEYQVSDWTPNGYTEWTPTGVNDLAKCTAAKNHILPPAEGGTGPPTAKEVINLTGFNCNLLFPSSSVTFLYDLAIISRGSAEWSSQTQWAGTGSDPKFFFIHPSSPAEAGADSCDIDAGVGTNYRADDLDDITISNLTNFNNLNMYFYTPCTIYASNNSAINGQMIAGNVHYSGRGSLNFQKSTVPGLDPVGYIASPQYIREVEN